MLRLSPFALVTCHTFATMELKISTPPNFSFRRTVRSHGWYGLPPFEFDESTWTLKRVLDVGQSKPVTTRITGTRGEILIKPSRRVSKQAADQIVRDVRHMFRLDDDLHDFYHVTSTEPDFSWISLEGAGRRDLRLGEHVHFVRREDEPGLVALQEVLLEPVH